MTINVELDKRLNRVVRKHERMRRNGVVHRVGRDGLIRTRPRLIRPRFPLKGVVITLALLVTFKALMFAQIGAANYALKVDGLRNGTLFEQAGAVMLQEEPVTVALGGFFRTYVFNL